MSNTSNDWLARLTYTVVSVDICLMTSSQIERVDGICAVYDSWRRLTNAKRHALLVMPTAPLKKVCMHVFTTSHISCSYRVAHV